LDYRSNKIESQVEANASPEIVPSSSIPTAQESRDMADEKAILVVSDGNMHTNAASGEDGLPMENNNSEIEVPKQVKYVPDDSFAATTKENCDYSVVRKQHFNSDKDSFCTHDSDSVDQSNKKVIISIPNSPSSRSSLSNSSRTHEENPFALQLYEPPPENCNKSSCCAVEDVLESLRRAKKSLRENLSKKWPLSDNQLLAITDRPHVEMDPYLTMRGSTPLDTQSMNIPVGSSSGLFRLPTDSFPKTGFSENFLSLEYSIDITKRLSMNSSGAAIEDYLQTQLLLDLPGARHASGSSSNLTSNMASSLPRFYEDLRTALPAGDRLFFYGGDSSFAGHRML
jgi:hypothetical protein